MEDEEERILLAHLLGHILLASFQLGLQLHVPSLVHAENLAESRSNGELFTDGRQAKPHLTRILGRKIRFSVLTPLLPTLSSTPPVMPNSISRMRFSGAVRLKYETQISVFSSSGFSERSRM